MLSRPSLCAITLLSVAALPGCPGPEVVPDVSGLDAGGTDAAATDGGGLDTGTEELDAEPGVDVPIPTPWRGLEDPTGVDIGTYARDLVLGDFDEDGDLDVAVPDPSARVVAILLGTGTGALGAPATFAIDASATGIVTADLDGDGHLDLAIGSSGEVTILLGMGDGTFGPATALAASNGLVDLAAADVDGDGDIDLATVADAPAEVMVFLNDGAGAFTSTEQSAGISPVAIELVAFDGDEHVDVVIADEIYGLGVLAGAGDGTFSSTLDSTTVPGGPCDLAIADADGDGDLDALVADASGDRVQVLLASGSTLGASTAFDAGDLPGRITTADLDRDGHLDVVLTNLDATTISVLLGDGTGALGEPQSTLVACGLPWGIVAGDLDGDAYPEVITADGCALGQVSVFANRGR